MRLIDSFFNYEIKIKSVVFKAIDLLFIFALWIFAFIVRFKLFPIQSADYWGFLEKWMQEIQSLGGFRSLSKEISNYTSPYMYLMCLVSGFKNSLYALKFISVIFDYLASIAVFLIIHELTKSTKKSILGMSILLLSPTVIIDGAYWCQCDIIYTCFILYAIYYFFKNNNTMCWVMVGIAFSFKLQTLFIVPFFIIMWLKNKNVKLLEMLYVPLIYVIMQLPAWMMGRPFYELMTVYFSQSDYYPWGTLEYPNAYALLDETMEHTHNMYEVTKAGSFFTIILLGFLAYYIYSKNIEMTNDFIITLAMFSVAIIVYTLPHMHERYGFLIDLLAIIYAVLRPKRLPVTVGFMLVSVLSFMPYLTAAHIFPIQNVAVLLLGLITFVGYDLYSMVKELESNQEAILDEAPIPLEMEDQI